MARAPWKFDPAAPGDNLATSPGTNPASVAVGGAGFKGAWGTQGVNDWLWAVNLLNQGYGQVNQPKGGIGFSASFGGAGSPTGSEGVSGQPGFGTGTSSYSGSYPGTLSGVTQPGASLGAASAQGTAGGLGGILSGINWGNVAQGAGALYGIYDARQQRKDLEGAGNTSSTQEPWGPTVPNRTFGLDEARRLYSDWMAQNPGFSSSRGPGVPGSNRGARAADALWDRASGGHPLYGPAYGASESLLAGDNPYREGAAARFASIGDYGANPYLDLAGARAANYQNPLLNDFIARLSGGDSLLGSSSGGFGVGGGGGGGGGGAGPVGAADYIKRLLDAEYSENPALGGVIDSMSNRIREQYERAQVPGIISDWQGSGRYGGGLYKDAQAMAAGQFADSLGEAVGNVQYQDYNDWNSRYMDALGLGTQYDISAEDRAQRASAAGASAGVSRANALDQLRFGREQMLLDAVGMYGNEQQYGLNSLFGAAGMLSNANQFGAAGLLDAGGQYDASRLSALGMVPELSGMDVRDLTAAFGAGSEVDAANADAAWNNYRIREGELMRPFDVLGRFADLTNAFGGAYGTSYGQQYVPPGPSNLQGAISGAALGGGLYKTFS